MLPKEHFFYGLIFALIVFLLFPEIGLIGFVVITLSSVLIDIDHYIYYVVRYKNFNIIKMIRWNLRLTEKAHHLPKIGRENTRGIFCIFHGVEVLLILFLLGFLYKIFFYIFLGFAFHIFLDVLSEFRCIGKITAKYSLIVDYLKTNKATFIEDY